MGQFHADPIIKAVPSFTNSFINLVTSLLQIV